MKAHNQNHDYGQGDATLSAVGGLDGLSQLVVDFYEIMDDSADYKMLRDMHPEDLLISIDKLIAFLSGWMGGERIYAKKYGGMSIPQAHSHLDVDEKKRDMWLDCMREALDRQDYPESLKIYLMEQLAFPAERIRVVSQARIRSDNDV